MPTLGEQFAEALAAKDGERIAELLDPEVDFRALTPNFNWEASTPEAVVEIVLGSWFEPKDHLDELVGVRADRIGDRQTVNYRLRGHNDDGHFLGEQQAYLEERDGRIVWMRVLCSGMRPTSA